jgi:hypothetical protein
MNLFLQRKLTKLSARKFRNFAAALKTVSSAGQVDFASCHCAFPYIASGKTIFD